MIEIKRNHNLEIGDKVKIIGEDSIFGYVGKHGTITELYTPEGTTDVHSVRVLIKETNEKWWFYKRDLELIQ